VPFRVNPDLSGEESFKEYKEKSLHTRPIYSFIDEQVLRI